MVQKAQILGNIDLGMVTPFLELCHPQAALEAATQDLTMPKNKKLNVSNTDVRRTPYLM